MAELRRDPITGDWVVTGYHGVRQSSTGDCPFCPGNEDIASKPIRETKDSEGAWLVRCVQSSSPVFVSQIGAQKKAEGLYDKMGNMGAHEIVVENRSHTKTMSGFSETELALVLDMFRDRVIDLKGDQRFKYVNIFKNHGELAGSYIFHPHAHLVATPIVPQRIELELRNAKRHYLQKGRCLFCDILNQETRQKKRVVSTNAYFVALCPFASKFPYETWILPRFHNERFEFPRDEEEKHALIAMILDLLKRVEKLATAYTIVVHTSPNGPIPDPNEPDLPLSDYYHWHIEVMPRDFRSSKYKREDEFYVISLTPEEAAQTLKSQGD
jgi:UDPglucose--hexose-1-phosphate uridylyltransferase